MDQTAFPRTTWRLLIEDIPRSGAANMAVDQAIAQACAAGESLPTLRFYRWDPPAVSLGRHQPLAEIDIEAATARGYEIVRRSTGGRAILHTDELTYSVAAPADEPRVQGGVMDAYLRLSNALLNGLQRLGLAADKAGGDVRAGKDVSAACFEVPSAYEITAHGRKLMGSAQSRRAKYVLQHGSLPLVGDVTRLIDVLVFDNEPIDGPHRILADSELTGNSEQSSKRADQLRRQLEEHACTLAQALQVDADHPSVQFQTVAGALVQGFAETLNLDLQPGSLTPQELRTAAQLIRTQYANDTWTTSR